MTTQPCIVGIGGTHRPNSSSELALRACLKAAEGLGARTVLLTGDAIDLPMYSGGPLSTKAQQVIEVLRQCDGLVISSPSYHGSLSGSMKNLLDYVEEMRGDARPYLDGRAVGSIVCAYGMQAIGSTLVGMRSIVHALRGWNTPMAAGINSSGKVFDEAGQCIDPAAAQQLELVARQVWEFAAMRSAWNQCGARKAA